MCWTSLCVCVFIYINTCIYIFICVCDKNIVYTFLIFSSFDLSITQETNFTKEHRPQENILTFYLYAARPECHRAPQAVDLK